MLVKMKRALVIINGYPVPKHFLNYFWQKNDIHICTDGSFHSVFKAGIPQIITKSGVNPALKTE